MKQDKKAPTPAVSGTQITDAEMDKVTAGVALRTLRKVTDLYQWANPSLSNLPGCVDEV